MIIVHSVSQALPVEDLGDWSECLLLQVYVEMFVSVISVVSVSHLKFRTFS